LACHLAPRGGIAVRDGCVFSKQRERAPILIVDAPARFVARFDSFDRLKHREYLCPGLRSMAQM
jgi:hypothetical protein